LVFIGIDPGLTGALVVLPLNGSEDRIEFYDTPILTVQSGKKLRKQMNAPAIRLMLDSILAQHGNDCLAVIEKVSAMPSFGKTKDGEEERRTMGAASAFNFGKGVGIWIGLLAGCQIPYAEVHPATWKAALLHGMGKGKDASVAKATQLFPRTASDLARKKDHGRADALMMAVYASRLRMTPGKPQVVEPEPSLF
jgi:Holliday junction resolvasome RuvABC endonuclease subunit